MWWVCSDSLPLLWCVRSEFVGELVAAAAEVLAYLGPVPDTAHRQDGSGSGEVISGGDLRHALSATANEGCDLSGAEQFLVRSRCHGQQTNRQLPTRHMTTSLGK